MQDWGRAYDIVLQRLASGGEDCNGYPRMEIFRYQLISCSVPFIQSPLSEPDFADAGHGVLIVIQVDHRDFCFSILLFLYFTYPRLF